MSACGIIVPVKGIAAGKSRLSAVLDDEARAGLILELARRTVALATSLADADVVVAVAEAGTADALRAAGARTIVQSGEGLNAALTEAAGLLSAVRTLVVPADLPGLSEDDLRAHLNCRGVGLSPDRHGTGTNLLSMPTPASVPFMFGAGSLDAHRNAARAAGLAVEIIDRPGIALDLDTPDDLIAFGGWPGRA